MCGGKRHSNDSEERKFQRSTPSSEEHSTRRNTLQRSLVRFTLEDPLRERNSLHCCTLGQSSGVSMFCSRQNCRGMKSGDGNCFRVVTQDGGRSDDNKNHEENHS